jgi:pimeloyl-ACP methyl ester carboxylesterase
VTGDRYQPRRRARERVLNVRGVATLLREWGDEAAPPLVLLHGARDTGASFQFVVDALAGEWHVIAPDWRGNGGSAWTPGSYWQAEFVADLDALLEAVLPGRAVTLVGHSMGGNIASLYAGTRPGRVERLVMLDALGGLLREAPEADEVLRLMLASRHLKPGHVYPSTDDLAVRLLRRNRRLDPAKARFLAAAFALETPHGFTWRGDPSFGPFPSRACPPLFEADHWGALWRHITAPVLLVHSTDPRPRAPLSNADEAERRFAYFADLTVIAAPDTGHNVHHDAPEFVAGRIEEFAAGR